MKHLNFFKDSVSKTLKVPEKKSFLYDSLLDARYGAGYNIQSTLALIYYASVSVVSIAIDKICEEFEVIKPQLLEKKNEKLITDAPILDFLNHPNSDETGVQFMGEIGRSYKITGNSFIIATGPINRPPLELFAVKPYYITIQESSIDSFPQSYTYNSSNQHIVFNRLEEGNRLRFVTDSREQELCHISAYNPGEAEKLWGLSKLNSTYLEISQYIQSNQHNLNILRQGVRSSGILSYESELTQDQRDNIKGELQSDYAGSNNAGRVFVFDGGKVDFKELSQTLKDMDFKDLKKEIGNTVYVRLDVPLPLVSTDNQKFDNMAVAKLSLYDEAVMPLTDLIYLELSLFLFPRFKIDPNAFTLKYNIWDISVLRERELLNIEKLSKTNFLLINELRAMSGREPVDGGDVLYQPLNLVPLGTSATIVEGDAKSVTLKNELKKIKYANGDDVYRVDER